MPDIANKKRGKYRKKNITRKAYENGDLITSALFATMRLTQKLGVTESYYAQIGSHAARFFKPIGSISRRGGQRLLSRPIADRYGGDAGKGGGKDK